MKLFPGRAAQKLLLEITLLSLVLAILVGCSGGTNEADAAPSEGETELDQLKTENDQLRTELSQTAADLKETESKIKELEDALTAMQETQAAPEESNEENVSDIFDAAPPELSSSDLLLGEWFDQEFYEDGIWSYTQSLVFNAGGTGTICRTYYIPKTEIENSGDYGLFDADMFSQFTWNLDGDTLHVDIDNEDSESVNFTYSSEQQEFYVGDMVYVRERPSGMEEYVERSLYAKDYVDKEALLRRRFLGNWYYDVMVWTFNDDGTGTLDIPELGDQPAETRKFSYSVSNIGIEESDEELNMNIDWDDADWGTWYCYPTFDSDGAMNLNLLSGSQMKLTRTFDENNCPVTMEIISRGMSVFSGSMFNDILGIDE